MTVSQYEAKFNESAMFVPHQVDTEERKARRFEQGLKPWLYSRIAVFPRIFYVTIPEKVIIAEGGSEALTQYHKRGRIRAKEREESRVVSNGKLTITEPLSSSRPMARTFNMTVQDAVASADLVAGIILVNTMNAYVPFDWNATCSVIA